MTEADWLTSTDFAALAQFAAGRLSPRRQRLLAVAFCRAVEHLFDHPELVEALATVERYADGRRDAVDMDRACQRCREIATEEQDRYARQVDGGASGGRGHLRSELAWAVVCAASPQLTVADVGTRAALAAVQARTGADLVFAPVDEFQAACAEEAPRMRAVVWEVVGNPFRSLDFAPWRTNTAVSLARQMYDSREFGAMPILADALQDAGCDNEEVLSHCRDVTLTHVRGCWVVDLVLSKA